MTSVGTNGNDLDHLDQEGNNPKVLLFIETDEQKQSLHHPFRKKILKALSAGIEDYETQITTEIKTLKDGTGLKHSLELKRPIQRYWLTVSELVDELCYRYPKLEITSYQCYYHLQKLEEQGLVEQDPAPEFNDDGKKRRIRGRRFRAAARFFIAYNPGFSPGNPIPCVEFLQNNWNLTPTKKDCEDLTDLIFQQDMALFKALEHLAAHLNEPDMDSVTLSVLLERLAHVFLSDNHEFIERYRKAKAILIRAGGRFLESDTKDMDVTQTSDAKGTGTRGCVNE
ncbi:MAG: winged helix-turn-helix domain-containing protein [Promethearchaeota archaeon]